MKKTLLLISMIALLSSCSEDILSPTESSKTNDRIIGKESIVYNSCRYQIIEVDGVEYITSNNGGIVKITK